MLLLLFGQPAEYSDAPSISAAFRAAALAQETGETLIVLLTVEHDDLETPFRFSSDPTSRTSDDPVRWQTQSRGNAFDFLPFQVRLPEQQEGAPPRAQLVLDNIARAMVAMLRSTTTPATVLIEIVLASSPDLVEIAFPRLRLVGVTYDAQTIQADLTLDHLATEPFGYMNFDPARFPSLFDKSLT